MPWKPNTWQEFVEEYKAGRVTIQYWRTTDDWAVRNRFISDSDRRGFLGLYSDKWKAIFVGRLLSNENDFWNAYNDSGIDLLKS